MKYRHFITIVGLVSVLAEAIDGAAQPQVNVEIGFRSGVPFTDSLTSRLTGAAAFFSSSSFVKPGYTLGPTLGMILNDQLEIEFDAIYKPVRFFGSSTLGPGLQSSSTTRGSSWEFPLLVNYRFLRRQIRPFGGSGIVMGALLKGATDTRTMDSRTGVESFSSGPFRDSVMNQGAALVINGGLEWRNSRFLIRPEIRYTHRPDANQNTGLLREPNQFEYLIGFSFLARSAGNIR
jgi:hypothetical protein